MSEIGSISARGQQSELLRAFRGGRWAPGERLPPERALAAEFGIGRATVRRELSKLEEEGRVRRRVGQGTFVTVPPNETVTAALRLSPPPGPADVLELRLMIEPQIAGAAALRASDPAIARLRRMAVEGAAAADWQSWESADSRFHTAVAAAARNPLLTGVLETLNLIRRQPDWARLRSSTMTPKEQREHTSQHIAVVDAIEARDPTGAAEAMRTHLAAVRRTMFGDDTTLAAIVSLGGR
jgi:GntR family uxuAB operon transcriptional repressor